VTHPQVLKKFSGCIFFDVVVAAYQPHLFMKPIQQLFGAGTIFMNFVELMEFYRVFSAIHFKNTE